ncbi:unnamed protein product [Pleuronectes platessa]|uniref:Uncharacterized protein n=1 Tax=Pleuronectes platessa TaxID=8262 RepID=A0A9N7UU69_PLEPL|nr:unnamed protein product [Pleuronectes platessa]
MLPETHPGPPKHNLDTHASGENRTGGLQARGVICHYAINDAQPYSNPGSNRIYLFLCPMVLADVLYLGSVPWSPDQGSVNGTPRQIRKFRVTVVVAWQVIEPCGPTGRM